ncbi:uncharacterized protein LOC111260578 [Varroa jacobsoni]|uniref:uncharacterized protein LOC111260578 n=1 Tax=Varroa jacobsoni TaxID=62625 RepID=UPI000BF3A794|nr:uncharacterized protein LOC111260578 [Varroa jacobsoni]
MPAGGWCSDDVEMLNGGNGPLFTTEGPYRLPFGRTGSTFPLTPLPSLVFSPAAFLRQQQQSGRDQGTWTRQNTDAVPEACVGLAAASRGNLYGREGTGRCRKPIAFRLQQVAIIIEGTSGTGNCTLTSSLNRCPLHARKL